MSKTERLVIRLTTEDREWLRTDGRARIGIDTVDPIIHPGHGHSSMIIAAARIGFHRMGALRRAAPGAERNHPTSPACTPPGNAASFNPGPVSRRSSGGPHARIRTRNLPQAPVRTPRLARALFAALRLLEFVSHLAEFSRSLCEPASAPFQFLIRQRSVAQEIKCSISHVERLRCAFVALAAQSG
jgi:hypothetical protein